MISIVNWLVRDSSSFITSPRVIVNHTPSARVTIVFDNYLYYLHLTSYFLYGRSSIGLSHVPSQPMGIPSPRGMIRRDSCLQPDTRYSRSISGNVFEDLPAPSEPPAAFFGNSRSTASAQCEPVSLNTGRLADRVNELERNTHNFAIPTPRFARKFSSWNLPFHAEGAYPQNCMVEQPRNQV